MRRGTGRGRAAHGARRAAQHRNNGENSSTIENVTTTRQHLQYEEIIAGMGYKINKKQQTENLKSSNESNNKEEEGENYDSDIENTERSRAVNEAACWFVPRLGNMTQDRRSLPTSGRKPQQRINHRRARTEDLQHPHELEFKMLSPLGVNHHVKTEWRNLAR